VSNRSRLAESDQPLIAARHNEPSAATERNSIDGAVRPVSYNTAALSTRRSSARAVVASVKKQRTASARLQVITCQLRGDAPALIARHGHDRQHRIRAAGSGER